MGLFDALIDVVAMPLRVGVDIVKLPGKILEGEDDLLENTSKGIKKIEKDLED
jgi:hypothetical protein